MMANDPPIFYLLKFLALFLLNISKAMGFRQENKSEELGLTLKVKVGQIKHRRNFDRL